MVILEMSIINCLIFLFFFCVLPSAFCAQEKIVLTLDEAIVIASRDNRDILLDEEKLAQAKQKIEESKSAFLPELTLGGTAADTRGLYRKDIVSYSFTAGLKQYVYKGKKSLNTLKESRHKKEAQEALLENTRSGILLKVKEAFYALLLAKDFNRLNNEIQENRQRYLESLKERYLKGELPESEVKKAEYRLSEADSLCEAARNQQELAGELLKSILYIEQNIRLDIEGGFEYQPRELAIDAAILEALSQRQEIRQYEAQMNADKAGIEIAKAANRPTIYGSFDYTSRSTTSLSFSPGKGWQDYNVVGFTMSWPIFDGWLTKAKVEQAISTLKQDEILKDKLKTGIVVEVKDAYLALKSAIARLAPTRMDIDVYKDNLKTIEAKYQEGIASELDLKDAALSLAVSDFNHKEALYDCLVSKARLDRATGVNKKEGAG